MTKLDSIADALVAMREGKFVLCVDDADRENEGDLFVAAEHITEAQMAFMIRHTSGIVFLSMNPGMAEALELPPMVQQNTSKRGTPFTVSIEAAHGVDTGVSAKDRVTTIKTAIAPDAKPSDLSRPGHIFPLRANEGGVLVRAGHTEASVDLARLAGLRPCAVGAELMHEDGTMMRLPALRKFADQHGMPLISVADLIAYRRRTESLVARAAESELDTATGVWRMCVYHEAFSPSEHVALVMGDVTTPEPVLMRVHSECLTGDAFGSKHCDCGEQLHTAMEKISVEGRGIILYLRQEGRGIGLTNKIRAYALQRHCGLDTVDANLQLGLPEDLRDYGVGAQILRDLGVSTLRLLTNNPKKVVALEGYGLKIAEQLPLVLSEPSEKQKKYLNTKRERMGHEYKKFE